MNHTQVLDLLVEHGVIGDDVVDDAVAEVTQSGLPLAKVLEKQGVMPEAQFYETIASMFGVETVNLDGFEPPDSLLEMLPANIATAHRARS